MDTTDGRQTLRDQAIYRDLSERGRSLLLNGAALADCGGNDVILRPGQSVSGAYLVLDGRLRVYTISPAGNEATLYTIDPGETCVLALNCLFNDLRYPAWVEAESTTQVAMIPGDLYRRLFTQESSIQDLTVQALSTAVFRLINELEQVHGLNNRQRLANLLLTRASSRGEVVITQQQLADHLGTRREVVARLLLDFAAGGCLETGRGRLMLLDPDALRAIAIGADEQG